MKFYITAAGVTAARNAAGGGFKITIATFKVSDTLGYVPTGLETALPGVIQYTGTPTRIYDLDANSVMVILRMDGTVGPFTYGCVGIYLDDGTLFAIGALPGDGVNKTKDATDAPGNVIEYDAAVQLSAIAAVINFPTYAGATAWGTITGVLSDQTDLQTALNGKQPLLGYTPVQQGTGVGQDNTIVVQIGQQSGDPNNHVSCTTGAIDHGNFVFFSDLLWGNLIGIPATLPSKWGTISGTLSSQTDLQAALNVKAAIAGQVFTGNISAPNLSGTNTGDQNLSNYVQEAPINGTLYGRKNAAWVAIPPANVPTWGGITGTLSAQTDLQAALNVKLNLAGGTMSGTLNMGNHPITNCASYNISDPRVKVNVRPYSEGTRELLGLGVYRYYNLRTGKAEVGVMAPDVAKFAPEAVIAVPDAEHGEILQVNLPALIPRLLGMIQQLESRIAALETGV